MWLSVRVMLIFIIFLTSIVHEFLWLIGEPTGLHTGATPTVFPWQLKVHHSANTTPARHKQENYAYLIISQHITSPGANNY